MSIISDLVNRVLDDDYCDIIALRLIVSRSDQVANNMIIIT